MYCEWASLLYGWLVGWLVGWFVGSLVTFVVKSTSLIFVKFGTDVEHPVLQAKTKC